MSLSVKEKRCHSEAPKAMKDPLLKMGILRPAQDDSLA